ncbi:MAG: GMC family oxidoreductase [Bdellovibrionales bacterium]|nr:GMC family oxidoreductase [Bdellovibrionales bacterium]
MKPFAFVALFLYSQVAFGSQFQDFLNQEMSKDRELIRRVHTSLYEVYLPDTLKNDPKYFDALKEGLEWSWSEIVRVKEIKLAFQLLARLEFLLGAAGSKVYYAIFKQVEKTPKFRDLKEASQGLKEFLRSSPNKRRIFTAFSDLSLSERRKLLDLMATADLSMHRRIPMTLKAFYSGAIYRGQFALDLAGATNFPPPANVSTKVGALEGLSLKTHLSVDHKKKRVEGELDYLIVGSGISGSILAHELYRAGKKVAVLEKGPFVHPTRTNFRDANQFLRNGGVMPNSVGDIILGMAEISGGGSTLNYDISFPVSDPSVLNHFREWRDQGLVSPKLFDEKALLAANQYVTQKIGVRTVAASEINENNRKLWDGAKALGRVPSMVRLTTLSDSEMKMAQHKDRATDKRSAAEVFLLPSVVDQASTGSPVSLLVNVAAKEILFKKSKAIGVEFEVHRPEGTAHLDPSSVTDLYGFGFKKKKRYKIYAKNIILASGTVGSSFLLENSGIKNENIGKGFVVHPVLPLIAKFPTIQDHYLGTKSSVYVGDQLTVDYKQPLDDYALETSVFPVDKIAMMVPGTPEDVLGWVKDFRKLTGAGVVLIDKPRYDNRFVFKKGKDDVSILYELSESDRARMKKGIAAAARILLAAGASEVVVNTIENYMNPPIIKSETDVQTLEKNLKLDPATTLMLSGHIMGSNKMGKDPATSVVNPQFQVWGTESLYVGDASIFPSSVGANPMMSIYTTAYLLSQHLLHP